MKKDKIDIDALLKQALQTTSKEEIEEARQRSWKRIEAEMDKRDDLAVRSLTGDGWIVGSLDQREFQVLSAVALTGTPRDPDDIHTSTETWAPGIEPAQVYVTLTRLENRGFITRHPGSSPGLRLYSIADTGNQALKRARLEGKVLESVREEGRLPDGSTEPSKSE